MKFTRGKFGFSFKALRFKKGKTSIIRIKIDKIMYQPSLISRTSNLSEERDEFRNEQWSDTHHFMLLHASSSLKLLIMWKVKISQKINILLYFSSFRLQAKVHVLWDFNVSNLFKFFEPSILHFLRFYLELNHQNINRKGNDLVMKYGTIDKYGKLVSQLINYQK